MLALFRTDCDSGQGMGHIMRCAALARSFRKLAVDVAFACSKIEGVAFARSEGYDTIDLFSFDTEDGLGRISSICTGRPALIVADSYEYDVSYLTALNSIAPTAYIDDLHTPHLGVSAIVNGNITADAEKYAEMYAGKETRLLIGTSYNILRSEFRGLGSPFIRDRVGRVLVASGGSDPHAASVKILQVLLGCPTLNDCELVVMAGPLSRSIDKLDAISSLHPRVKVLRGVAEVAILMRSCDMAIAAAGGTLNELCACGVPSIAYALADNQVNAVGRFLSAGSALDGGAVWDEDFASKLDRLANMLVCDVGLRRKLSENGRFLFDGLGAERISSELMDMVGGAYRKV